MQKKAPKNVTGLEMYKESANSFKFRFDAVLEDGDSYELQYTDKAQPSEEDWVTASSSGYYDEDEDEYYEDDDALTLSKSLLKRRSNLCKSCRLCKRQERKQEIRYSFQCSSCQCIQSHFSDQ